MASSFCHSALARNLDITIQMSLCHTMHSRLACWWQDLQKTFKDPHGQLGQQVPNVAACITDFFPSTNTAICYTQPATSGMDCAFVPDPASWALKLPDMKALCKPAWKLFNDQDIIKFCRDTVWESIACNSYPWYGMVLSFAIGISSCIF